MTLGFELRELRILRLQVGRVDLRAQLLALRFRFGVYRLSPWSHEDHEGGMSN
jgi:ribosomal protein L29